MSGTELCMVTLDKRGLEDIPFAKMKIEFGNNIYVTSKTVGHIYWPAATSFRDAAFAMGS